MSEFRWRGAAVTIDGASYTYSAGEVPWVYYYAESVLFFDQRGRIGLGRCDLTLQVF